MNTPIIVMSPYLRIAAAGFDIDIKNHAPKFQVRLMRGEEKVAVATTPRSGVATAEDELTRARLNKCGPTSSLYLVLGRFADIAETLAAAKSHC